MSVSRAVIDELEVALQSGSIARRTELLQRVTDLFLGGAGRYSVEQISLFDDVLSRLIADIEGRVLAELGTRLAPVESAPGAVIRRLAWDDDIAVSGPVLQQSKQLTDDDLVKIAKSKSQRHLREISRRERISEAVTDIIVDRGDAEVANEVAANRGARFSKTGLSKLAISAEGDDRLTTTIVGRPDLPPLLLRHVLARATDTVRERLLMSAQPAAREALRKILTEVSRQMSGSLRPQQYVQAQRTVAAISQDTALTKAKLWEFAAARRLAETVVALSVLSAVPIDLVDHLVGNPSPFGAMVLCKAVGLNWKCAEAVIRARRGSEQDASLDIQSLEGEYQLLSPPSAQRLLRFWQARQDQIPIAERKGLPGNGLKVPASR